jgi:hypothetical protein
MKIMRNRIYSRLKNTLLVLFTALISFTACKKDKPIICELDIHEPNNTIDSFKILGELDEDGSLISILGTISDSEDLDFYKIEVEEPELFGIPGQKEYFQVLIELTSPSGKDYDIYLYDEDGVVLLASSSNKGDVKEMIDYNWEGIYGFEDGKEFIIEVRPYTSSWSCEDYTLDIVFNFSRDPI